MIAMAQQSQAHQETNVKFKTIKLYKEQVLGSGSYGTVYRAKCDDLVCAAKILHPTLFIPSQHFQISPKHVHRQPIKRFEAECEFLNTIRHPNIVQYLDLHQDPDNNLSVLLMELMDDNLTHYLENTSEAVPYHIQVNICHDIALALSFLHSNNIVHRDLSSNNILMIGNIRAKVADFGMARLGDINHQTSRLTFTMCPGAQVYMPPEAVKEKPVYTEKVDCFSFGVITVQILSRKFPAPDDRFKPIEDPQMGHNIAVIVSEVDRRQNHIHEVDRTNSLLPIAISCLKDKDVDRPSAQQLCERLSDLKESQEYDKSSTCDPKKQRILELEQQIRDLQEAVQFHRSRLEQNNFTITMLRQQIPSNTYEESSDESR